MTPGEKTLLDQRARRAGISTAEFVRRRIGLDDRSEEIESLLAMLAGSAPNILRALDEAIETAGTLQSAIDVGA